VNNKYSVPLLAKEVPSVHPYSFDRNFINAHQYSVDGIDFEHVQHIKGLGINFDVKLNFSLHISEKG